MGRAAEFSEMHTELQTLNIITTVMKKSSTMISAAADVKAFDHRPSMSIVSIANDIPKTISIDNFLTTTDAADADESHIGPAKLTATATKEMDFQLHQTTFPYKLYEMLEYACDSEFNSACSWSADGSAFVIHNKEVMMEELVPMFFKQTKFRSFVSPHVVDVFSSVLLPHLHFQTLTC